MPELGWFPLILLSALSLGVYDFSKKHAVNSNRVMLVLFIATLCGTLFLMATHLASGDFLASAQCTPAEWGLVMVKSLIVAASWIAGYYALHDLPISLAAPIRASAPMWVNLGGFLLLGECPNLHQLAGIIVVFAGLFLFNVSGRHEGFSFKSRGVRMIIAATLIGASSAIYDRYILHNLHLDANMVQFHFSVDLVLLLGAAWVLQKHIPFMKEDKPFQWRWSIPLIGILLIAADYFFFHALAAPNTQIGVLSVLRRTSVVVSFLCGAIYFREKGLRVKTAALALVLAGIVILAFS